MSHNENAPATDQPAAPKRQLTLFDSTCIIVGIIIGSGIYETSPKIAREVCGLGEKITASVPLLGNLAEHSGVVAWLLSDAALILGVWVLGGILSLLGALCYAELATAYPKSGGDYVYLTRAFGRAMGFIFAWAQLWVVRPGSIGLYAYVFARYANQIWNLGDSPQALMAYAAGSIVVLTGVNILGVRESKWTQNVLTTIKVLGLAAIFVVGLFCTAPAAPAQRPSPFVGFGLAMIYIFYTYGGWNEMAYVGAEVRDPKRNILRALVLGTAAVTLIYVLVNAAFLHVLGVSGFAQSEAVATDVLNLVSGWGGRLIAILICISALGAINGMVFTGARIYYAMGTEHRLYSWLGTWDERTGTPVSSLLIQAFITLVPVVAFGMYTGGFDALMNFTAPVFWAFFLLVGLSLFALRWREPALERPYRVPLYPVVPVVFCLSSAYMLYSSVTWAYSQRRPEALWSIVVMVIGIGLAFVGPGRKEK